MTSENRCFDIHALPGFLGTARDWDGSPFEKIEAIDMCSAAWVDHLGWIESKEGPIPTWARHFNKYVSEKRGPSPSFLLGYSLGARFAIHALLENPQLWAGAILVSTHPGIKDAEARYQRLQRDEEWAKRFEIEPWKKVMSEWDDQEVFVNDTFSFTRREMDYDRKKLSRLLQRGSLGLQKDLREAVAALSIPLLWINGESDMRFRQLTVGMTLQHPLSRFEVIKQGGHRVPWENPDDFWEATERFIDDVLQESICKYSL